MALPCFAAAGGPFGGRAGSVTGPAPRTAQERYALATLYCVLMSDYCLSALGVSEGEIVVEGSYTGNPYFAPLLAALRPSQPVVSSDDASGTTCGAWMLAHWGAAGRAGNDTATPAAPAVPAAALPLPGWAAYRARWLAALQGGPEN